MKVLLIFFILLTTSLSSISQLSEINKNEFNKNIREGDSYFSQGKFLEAKDMYEKALALNPSDKYALNQRDKSITNSKDKTGEEEGKNYQKIINKADEKFNNNDLENAKSLYQRALGLKPNDTYPKRKIEEIDAKLNPKKVEKATPLADLGISSNLSNSDAEKILADAEIKRQNRKNYSLDSNTLKLNNSQSDISENRTKEINNSNINIKEASQKTELNFSNSISKQDSTLKNIRSKENKITNDNNLYSNLQNTKEINKSLGISKKLSNLDSLSLEHQPVGAEMDVYITLKTVRFTDSIEIAEKKIKEDLNYKITELNDLNYKEQKKTTDNQNDKLKYFSKIDSTVVNLDSLQLERNNKIIKSHDNSNLNIATKELKTNNSNDSIYNQSNKIQYNNSLNIKSNDGTSVDSLFILDNSNKIEKTNRLQAINQELVNDENLNDLIKLNTNKNTQVNITKVIDDNQVIEKSGKSNQDTSIDKLQKIDQKQFDVINDDFKKNQANEYSKADQINTNISKVNTAYKTENSANDGINISSQSNNISLEYENEEKRILNNKQDIVDFLKNLDSKSFKFDEGIANSIGALYPEGVTEESFNKNDEQGLAYAVVTRRIVVKNGSGSIYIKTVSKNAITYSKNGQPTTEHCWQIETQDAKLKRN
jgi:hypothetical protein